MLQSQRRTQQQSTNQSWHAYAYCMHECYSYDNIIASMHASYI